MRILLINPPMSDPSLPSLSVPTLSAFARSQGYNVGIYDLAKETFDYFTRQKTIEEKVKIIKARLNDPRLQQDKEFQKIARVVEAIAPTIIERIVWAKNGLRSEACFYNYESYRSALFIIDKAMTILSGAYYPTLISADNYTIKEKLTLRAVEGHLESFEQNAFLAYFQKIVLPKISADKPDLIGVSVTYRGQLLSTLTLLREIHKASPNLEIVLGGAYLTALSKRLAVMEGLLRGARGVVLFEGETALVEIAERIESGLDIKGVVNTCTFEDIRQGNILTQPSHIENFDKLPTPDFDGVPLDRYLTPEPVLPVQTCRGCYWGKCTFCAVSKATSGKFRKGTLSKITTDLDTLYEKYSCSHFIICDDATPPTTLDAMATHVIQNQLPYRWSTEARFGPWLTETNCRKLSKGGCVHLTFGFESASERILSLMQKGPIHRWRMQNLQACREANIGANLQTFFGFPGEEITEAKLTEDFFIHHKDLFTSISVGSFSAVLGCKVASSPSSFGVKLLKETEPLLEPIHNFEVNSGLTPKEAAKLAGKVHSDLVMYDILGPGLMYGSVGAHGHLYSSRFGRQFIDNLSTDIFRWEKDITRDRFIASESSKTVFLSEEEYMIFDRISGYSLIVQDITKRAFDLFKDSPNTITDAAAACLSSEGIDNGELQSLTKTIASLIRLVRNGVLVPVTPSK